ncbi:hypothetical protein Tco_1115487, partial [Tanacetum coccineum]
NVTAKDTSNGKETLIYSAKDVISALKTPIVKDAQVRWVLSDWLRFGMSRDFVYEGRGFIPVCEYAWGVGSMLWEMWGGILGVLPDVLGYGGAPGWGVADGIAVSAGGGPGLAEDWVAVVLWVV